MAESEGLRTLREAFEQIRDERGMHANTATRIGNAFLAIIPFLANNIDESLFLRKDREDVAREIIKFLKGVVFGNGEYGVDGKGNATLASVIASALQSPDFVQNVAGWVLKNDNGESVLEIDHLVVRRLAEFFKLIVREYAAFAGNQIKSSAASVIEDVVGVDSEGETVALWIGDRINPVAVRIRAYWTVDNGTTATTNSWVVGMQAICQTFNIALPGTYESTENIQRYYFRRVVGVGYEGKKGYVEFSLEGQAGYVATLEHDSLTNNISPRHIPAAGDSIVHMGYQPQPSDWTPQGTLSEEAKALTTFMVSRTNGPGAMADESYQGVGICENNDPATCWSLSGRRVKLDSPNGFEISSKHFRLVTDGGYEFPLLTPRGEFVEGRDTAHIYETWTFKGCLCQCLVTETVNAPFTYNEDGERVLNPEWYILVDKGQDGESAFFLDLGNEFDTIPTRLANDGTVVLDVENGGYYESEVHVFYGSDDVTSECDFAVECDLADDIENNIKASGWFAVTLADDEVYDTDIIVTASHPLYKTCRGRMKLRAGKPDTPVINILPSVNSVHFAADGFAAIETVTASFKVRCNGSTFVKTAADILNNGLFGERYFLRYSLTSMPTSKVAGNAYPSQISDGLRPSIIGINVARPSSGIGNLYLALFANDGTLLDRETIPIVLDGKRGADGTSVTGLTAWWALHYEGTGNGPTEGWSEERQDMTLALPYLWQKFTWMEGSSPCGTTAVCVGYLARDGVGSYSLDLTNEMACVGLVFNEEIGAYVPIVNAQLDGESLSAVETDVYVAGGSNNTPFYEKPKLSIGEHTIFEDGITSRNLDVNVYHVDVDAIQTSGGKAVKYRIRIYFLGTCTWSQGEMLNIRVSAKADVDGPVPMAKDMAIMFMSQGTDGKSPVVYQLLPSHDTIKFDKYGKYNGSESVSVSCIVTKTTGDKTEELDRLPDSLRMLSNGSIYNYGSMRNASRSDRQIRWELQYDINGNGNWVTIDREEVPVMQDPPGVSPSMVFKRFAPGEGVSAPVGGSYDYPVPDGWSDGIPEPTDELPEAFPVYLSKRTFYSDNSVVTEWSTPLRVGDTADLDMCFSKTYNPKNPSLPPSADNTNQDDDTDTVWHDTAQPDDIYIAIRRMRNGVWEPWQINRMKGEDAVSYISGTVKLHKRSDEQPASEDLIKGTLRYYFFPDQQLYQKHFLNNRNTAIYLNGWSLNIPSGTTPCWVIQVPVVAEKSDDNPYVDIAADEWTEATELVRNGDDGNSIISANVKYAVHTNETSAPGANAFTYDTITPAQVEQNKFIWQGTEVTYSKKTTEMVGKICLGSADQFAAVEEVYAVCGSELDAPSDSAFKTTFTAVKGLWLWTASRLTGKNSRSWLSGVHCAGRFPDDGPAGKDSFDFEITPAHYTTHESGDTPGAIGNAPTASIRAKRNGTYWKVQLRDSNGNATSDVAAAITERIGATSYNPSIALSSEATRLVMTFPSNIPQTTEKTFNTLQLEDGKWRQVSKKFYFPATSGGFMIRFLLTNPSNTSDTVALDRLVPFETDLKTLVGGLTFDNERFLTDYWSTLGDSDSNGKRETLHSQIEQTARNITLLTEKTDDLGTVFSSFKLKADLASLKIDELKIEKKNLVPDGYMNRVGRETNTGSKTITNTLKLRKGHVYVLSTCAKVTYTGSENPAKKVRIGVRPRTGDAFMMNSHTTRAGYTVEHSYFTPGTDMPDSVVYIKADNLSENQYYHICWVQVKDVTELMPTEWGNPGTGTFVEKMGEPENLTTLAMPWSPCPSDRSSNENILESAKIVTISDGFLAGKVEMDNSDMLDGYTFSGVELKDKYIRFSLPKEETDIDKTMADDETYTLSFYAKAIGQDSVGTRLLTQISDGYGDGATLPYPVKGKASENMSMGWSGDPVYGCHYSEEGSYGNATAILTDEWQRFAVAYTVTKRDRAQYPRKDITVMIGSSSTQGYRSFRICGIKLEHGGLDTFGREDLERATGFDISKGVINATANKFNLRSNSGDPLLGVDAQTKELTFKGAINSVGTDGSSVSILNGEAYFRRGGGLVEVGVDMNGKPCLRAVDNSGEVLWEYGADDYNKSDYVTAEAIDGDLYATLYCSQLEVIGGTITHIGTITGVKYHYGFKVKNMLVPGASTTDTFNLLCVISSPISGTHQLSFLEEAIDRWRSNEYRGDTPIYPLTNNHYAQNELKAMLLGNDQYGLVEIVTETIYVDKVSKRVARGCINSVEPV